MIFGSTKTKLDIIVEVGIKRINEAVEAVCDGYQWEMPDVRRCTICDKVNPHDHQDFCYELSCSGPMDKASNQWCVDGLSEERRILPRYKFDRMTTAQNILNQSAIFNNHSALGGLRSGSLFNQLGAAAHGVLGRMM